MQDNIDIHELFDRYLNSELADSEKVEFDSKLEHDETFRKEFQLYSDIVAGIKITAEEQLRNKFKELDNQASISGKRVMTFMYLAAAIVLLAVVGTGIIIKMNQQKQHDDIIAANEHIINPDDSSAVNSPDNKSNENQNITPAQDEKLLAMNIYKDNYDQYPNRIIPKSRGEVPTDSLPLAMYYYDNQDYVNAENILAKLKISEPENQDISFYLAMSKMAINRKGALEILLTLEKNKSAKYYFPSIWYSALLYLQASDNHNAILQLNKLTIKDNPFKGSAEEILKLIKK